jgi:hypothetical protein
MWFFVALSFVPKRRQKYLPLPYRMQALYTNKDSDGEVDTGIAPLADMEKR